MHTSDATVAATAAISTCTYARSCAQKPHIPVSCAPHMTEAALQWLPCAMMKVRVCVCVACACVRVVPPLLALATVHYATHAGAASRRYMHAHTLQHMHRTRVRCMCICMHTYTALVSVCTPSTRRLHHQPYAQVCQQRQLLLLLQGERRHCHCDHGHWLLLVHCPLQHPQFLI